MARSAGDGSIEIAVNGESRPLQAESSVTELLAALGLGLDRVAVEVNRQLVPRRHWDCTIVRDRDQVEVVEFVGGG